MYNIPMSTEQTKPPVEKIDLKEEPKKEVMGIERDDEHARLSFTQDGALMIVTIPIAKMSPVMAHGFIYTLHDVVKDWFAERKKTKIITRDEVNKFSFRSGVSKL